MIHEMGVVSLESVPELSCPGKRRQQVMPDMTAEMRWLRSPKVGVVSFRVRKQMSYNASLSRTYWSSQTTWSGGNHRGRKLRSKEEVHQAVEASFRIQLFNTVYYSIRMCVLVWA